MSYMALNRIVENPQRLGDKSTEPPPRRPGPVLSDARALSDQELRDQLAQIGVSLDRSDFARASEPYLSAEQMCRAIVQRIGRPEGRFGSDWLWCCLTALWERWLPSRPSFEMLDDRMQEGYLLAEKWDLSGACRTWAEVWKQIVRIVDARGFDSVEAFDDAFRGTQCLYNWVQDFEMELGNAALNDDAFHQVRIRLCEDFLERFGGEDRSITEGMQGALAEACSGAGDIEAAEALFQRWLTEDPRWGWGWIYWSDLYSPTSRWPKQPDIERAERLLRKGLAVPDIRDRADLVDRLKTLYEETGRTLESTELEHKPRIPAAVALGGQKARGKVGRNEPCPCGSGLKYKKCCART